MSEHAATLSSLHALRDRLAQFPSLAIAVSGGVDSLTLAAVACDVLQQRALVVHAESPAVPPEATVRVRTHAKRAGWSLKIVTAGEFNDERYRDNPVNRCYYCKSNLYQRLREVWPGAIASGANLDDLGDYRPGLKAASERNVAHPLVDCGINKAMVRRIATHLQLTDVAELPAQPCLSSRIETGIAIKAEDLQFVHRIEQFLAGSVGPGDVRCRVTALGIRLEIPHRVQQQMKMDDAEHWQSLLRTVEQMIVLDGRVFAGYGDYQRGSAFIHSAVIAQP